MIKRIVISLVLFILLFVSKKYKAIRITPKIYNNINANMADLVLYDENNEPVPYFINSFKEIKTETQKSYAMKLVNSFVKDEYYYLDYALEEFPDEDIIATSIEIKTENSGFAKRVEVFYSVEKKYTHYRFKISNNLEKISFSSVELKYNLVYHEKEYFTETLSPEYNVAKRFEKPESHRHYFKNRQYFQKRSNL